MHNDALFWKAIWWHSSQNWRFLLQDSSNHGPWGFAFKFHNLLLMLKFWASTFPLWLACCHKEVVGNKGWSNQSCRAGSSAPGPRTITCPWTLGHGHVATGPSYRTQDSYSSLPGFSCAHRSAPWRLKQQQHSSPHSHGKACSRTQAG